MTWQRREVCERPGRGWVCSELVEEYLQGAMARFDREPQSKTLRLNAEKQVSLYDDENHYKVPRLGLLWNGTPTDTLPPDGGRRRPAPQVAPADADPDPQSGSDTNG